MSLGRVSIALQLAVSLVGAACVSQQPAPAPTSSPPTASSAPAVVPSAPSPTVASASSQYAASQSPLPAAQAPAGAVRLTLEAEGNEARYRAREQFAGRDAMSDAVGVTSAVRGNIVLGPGGDLIADQSRIVVDLRSLKSDQTRRDNFIQRDPLQTERFPTAELVARKLSGLPWPLPTSGGANFKMEGDLTVRDVSRPTTWDVNATFSERGTSGQASTGVRITEFGMPIPRVSLILSINDDLTLELAFNAERG